MGDCQTVTFWEKKTKGKNNLGKNEEIISDDVEAVNTLKIFYLNIVKNLKILEQFAVNNLSHGLSKHPTLNLSTERIYR